ncbi:hypothetical protein SSOG_01934 [Streptomyces himastatinicus ATCC 53653]|uniref:Uncharacterized protein n=1 Tax=Streptomyces himastatinicus ATCC 53653 TaxID=457427 RepID=D9WTX4_9ACTN|nr:hypothetical protein [Streptomyces himastatinicus]EFL22223.1 hypothetical protein SSOG_01934 [Streptomyces himastatinicus ATCC 53653]
MASVRISSSPGAGAGGSASSLGDEANDELTAGLSAAEREQLMALLRRVAEPDEPCREA